MLRALVAAVIAGATVSFANATLLFLTSSGSYGKQLLRNTAFDYIVVGGGTAGLTVARRLTESSTKRVLVIEPGGSGSNNPLVTVPGKEYQFIGTDIDWFYYTQPQSHAANLSINLSSGKILGGDSSVNGLVWVRPPVAEYDAFEELGSAGWNWDNMYAAMKKSERLFEPSAAHQAEYGYYAVPSSHGTNGPINVTFPPFIPLQHQKFVNASIELGHHFNTDPYSGNNTGTFWSLSSQNCSSGRVSAEFGYLNPIHKRTNLVVFSGGLVTRLSFINGPDVIANGVFVRFPDGSEQLARLTPGGEVIMSAGTVRTPQILELSGIGNKDILDKFGINVRLDLPAVGENYEDHTITLLTYQLKPGYFSADALKYNATFLSEQEQLYTRNQGFFTFAISGVVMAPIESILNASDIETAKQILSVKPPTISQDLFDTVKSQILNSVPQIEFLLFDSFSAGGEKLPNTSYASLAITHVHPLSRGSIHINSTSIDDHPLIDPNVLESDWDRWFLAKATAYARRFFQTEAMLEIFEPTEVFPGSGVQTQDQWEQYVTQNINIGYHSVGTSSLLPQDKNGVVGANLVIYGTKNIRVVDASIMPLLISAHTQPAAYAIGERAAEIIMNTW